MVPVHCASLLVLSISMTVADLDDDQGEGVLIGQPPLQIMLRILVLFISTIVTNLNDDRGEGILIGQSLYTSCFFFWFYPFRR
jgi:hypothetical protein